MERLPSREMRISPDGRYIAYDLPPRENSPHRDIFLLGIDGGQETPLVEGPGIERVLDWTRDGKWLLFDSDRGLPSRYRASVQSGGSRALSSRRPVHHSVSGSALPLAVAPASQLRSFLSCQFL